MSESWRRTTYLKLIDVNLRKIAAHFVAVYKGFSRIEK